jgi:hypothetical protein
VRIYVFRSEQPAKEGSYAKLRIIITRNRKDLILKERSIPFHIGNPATPPNQGYQTLAERLGELSIFLAEVEPSNLRQVHSQRSKRSVATDGRSKSPWYLGRCWDSHRLAARCRLLA